MRKTGGLGGIGRTGRDERGPPGCESFSGMGGVCRMRGATKTSGLGLVVVKLGECLGGGGESNRG